VDPQERICPKPAGKAIRCDKVSYIGYCKMPFDQNKKCILHITKFHVNRTFTTSGEVFSRRLTVTGSGFAPPRRLDGSAAGRAAMAQQQAAVPVVLNERPYDVPRPRPQELAWG
jgi:hypothetical protein